MLMWKIAWRNIWRHKAKSFVIGIILFLGAFLMTVGNGMIDGAKQGLEDNMINSLTGHLIVLSEAEEKDDVKRPEIYAPFINTALTIDGNPDDSNGDMVAKFTSYTPATGVLVLTTFDTETPAATDPTDDSYVHVVVTFGRRTDLVKEVAI